MKLSIALATCNGAAHLRAQLESFAAQTRLPDELIVTDDCSDDQTVAIVEAFAQTATFPVSVTVNDKRLGVGANFTRAIGLCQGQVICPADQDDVWLPNKLAEVEAAFAAHRDLAMVFADMHVAGPAMEPTRRTQWQRLGFSGRLRRRAEAGDLFTVLLKFNVVNGAAMAFRADLRDILLPVPPGWIHDEWIALLCSALGPTRLLPSQWVMYRQHADQQIGAGVSGWWAQWRYARRYMNAAYFEGMVDRTAHALARLRSAGNRVPAHCLELVAQRLAHFQRRVRMRQQPRWRRWPGVIGEAARGGYSRFGYGGRSILQDLFL